MANLNHINLRLNEAQNFVKRWHRHSKPLKRHMFSIGGYSRFIMTDGHTVPTEHRKPYPIGLEGIITVDRASSAWSAERHIIELRRVCLADHAPKNMASFLINKARDACLAMGYKKIVTYTQPYESGASLRAAGFWLDAFCDITRDTDGNVDGVVRWEFIAGHRLSEQGRQNQKMNLDRLDKFIGGQND